MRFVPGKVGMVGSSGVGFGFSGCGVGVGSSGVGSGVIGVVL